MEAIERNKLRCHRPALCALAHQDRATQYAAAYRIDHSLPGVLDPRLRGDDELWRDNVRTHSARRPQGRRVCARAEQIRI